MSLRQAQELVTASPLRFVGVFQNQEIDFIVKIANQLQLYAVQLHGVETEEFIPHFASSYQKTRKFGKRFRSIPKPKVRSIYRRFECGSLYF